MRKWLISFIAGHGDNVEMEADYIDHGNYEGGLLLKFYDRGDIPAKKGSDRERELVGIFRNVAYVKLIRCKE